MKFGGTSVGDASALRRAREIVCAGRLAHPVVVVSAMSRVTEALLTSVGMALRGDPAAATCSLDAHLERHAAAARELSLADISVVDSTIERARRELGGLLEEVSRRGGRPLARLRDEIVSRGEHLSAVLLTAALREGGLPAEYVDARHCIITDDGDGPTAPLLAQTARATRAALLPLLEAGTVPVLGGFIGRSADGATTTLGRGGSDYTATLIGMALAAREVQIWTDVPGVLTAASHLIEKTYTVAHLSYAEAAHLARLGVKVLHPKTVGPLVGQRIPLRVCNSRAPEEEGTWVHAAAAHDAAAGTVKALAYQPGVTEVRVTRAGNLGAGEFVHAFAAAAGRHQSLVGVLGASESSAALLLDEAGLPLDLQQEIHQFAAVEVQRRRRAVVSVVGEGLYGRPGLNASILEALGDIEVEFVTGASAAAGVQFVIDEERAVEAVRRLHETLIECPREPARAARQAAKSNNAGPCQQA